MRRLTPATLAVVVLLSAAGCGILGNGEKQDPRLILANATDLYSTTVETMTHLSQAGDVSTETLTKFDATRKRAAGLLDAAEAAIKSGETFSVADLQSTLHTLESIVTLALQAVQK